MATKQLAYTLYTYTASGGSAGAAGDIAFGASIPPVTVDQNQVTGLNGDAWVFSFFDNNGKLLIALSQTGSTSVAIYDPHLTGGAWTAITGSPFTWTGVNNLQGLVGVGSDLYAINYGGTIGTAIVVKIPFSSYTVSASYTLPARTNTTKYVGAASIVAVGTNIYVLVVESTVSTFLTYNPSYAVKIDTTATFPPTSPTFGSNALGLNAVDLVPYTSGGATVLYVPCIGGAQGSSQNTGTRVDQVAVPSMTVTQHIVDHTKVSGNYYDVAISSGGDTFVLDGLYNTAFTSFTFDIYKTTASGLTGGTIGNKYQSTSDSGYYWHVLYQSSTSTASPDYLWFSRGNKIQLFKAPFTIPASPPPYQSPITSLPSTALGTSLSNSHINSFTPLWTASGLLLRAIGHRGGSASHLRLAREARANALARKKQKK